MCDSEDQRALPAETRASPAAPGDLGPLRAHGGAGALRLLRLDSLQSLRAGGGGWRPVTPLPGGLVFDLFGRGSDLGQMNAGFGVFRLVFFSPGESQVHGLLQEIEKTASAVGQIPLSSKFGGPFGSWSRHKTKNETFLSPPDPFLIRRLPFPSSLVLAWQRRSFQLC